MTTELYWLTLTADTTWGDFARVKVYDNGTLIPILQGGIKRSPELPSVPLMQDLTEDATFAANREGMLGAIAALREHVAMTVLCASDAYAVRGVIDAFGVTVRRALDGRPGKSYMPIGLRGVGKTVGQGNVFFTNAHGQARCIKSGLPPL